MKVFNELRAVREVARKQQATYRITELKPRKDLPADAVIVFTPDENQTRAEIKEPTMKRPNPFKIVFIAAIVTVVFIAAVLTAAVKYQDYSAKYRSENVCIQGWIDMGMERKHIHRHNGTCFYSKTTNKWVN